MLEFTKMTEGFDERLAPSTRIADGFERGRVIWVDHTSPTGRLRCAYPMIVVADRLDLTALYIPPSTTFLGPVDRDGRITRDVQHEAGVGIARWNDHAALHLIPSGAGYTAMARWRSGWDDFAGWHVSFQRPLRRTPTGFDTCDLTLDIEVFPDFSWSYKDEEEYWGLCRAGVFGVEERTIVQRAADDSLRRLDELITPFRPEIASWRPSADWDSSLTDDHLARRMGSAELSTLVQKR